MCACFRIAVKALKLQRIVSQANRDPSNSIGCISNKREKPPDNNRRIPCIARLRRLLLLFLLLHAYDYNDNNAADHDNDDDSYPD